MISFLKKSMAIAVIAALLFCSNTNSVAQGDKILNEDKSETMPCYRPNFIKCNTMTFKDDKNKIAKAAKDIFPEGSIKVEGDYVLSCQYVKEGDPASGAINDVQGDPTWVVPRENGLAILALLASYKDTKDPVYLERAKLTAKYLAGIQDSDGAWFNQYNYVTPGDPNDPNNKEALSKSPTQTAEVMMALYKLGYDKDFYETMKKGAEYLLACQDPANKGGADDGLIGGGKDAYGNYSTWRWASDNSFAYQALKATAEWALRNHDRAFATECENAASEILNGINDYLYIDDKSRSDYGVWYRTLDENDNPVNPEFHDWINYAPQMIDLPAKGVGNPVVGEWIHNTFQKEDGAVVWNDGAESSRKSPGFSFQAILVWADLGQKEYAINALEWAKNSGLWQTTLDQNNVSGGWIDWAENSNPAPFWQRFIDTSFYFSSAVKGGYDFNCGMKHFPGNLHYK